MKFGITPSPVPRRITCAGSRYSYNATWFAFSRRLQSPPTLVRRRALRRCPLTFAAPSGLLRLSRLHASSSHKKTSLPNTTELLPAQSSLLNQLADPDSTVIYVANQPTWVSQGSPSDVPVSHLRWFRACLGGIVATDQQTSDRWNSIPLLCVSAKCTGKSHSIDTRSLLL